MTTVLGSRYELVRPIAVGGMADVFEAFDSRLGRRVAVKILRADLPDARARERFEREARLSASFDHPNAVRTLDVGDDGSRPFLVMELVDGRDLARHLATNGPMSAEQAIGVLDPVLRALGAAHERGIVHRDVKPANILLADDGRVWLADFGIAKAMSDATSGLTAPGIVIGTPRYLAPEQLRGVASTPQSDLYSVGVVLYEMLAGQPPFPDDTVIAAATSAQVPDVAPLSTRRADLSPALLAAVERALSPEPTKRYPDAESMRLALLAPAPDATPTVPLSMTVLQPRSTLGPPVASLPPNTPPSTQREPIVPPKPTTPTIPATTATAIGSPQRQSPPLPPPRHRRFATVGLALVAIVAVVALSALAVGLIRSGDDAGAATTTEAVPVSATTQTATTQTATTRTATSVPTPTTTTARATTTPPATTAASTTATTARPTTTTRAATTVAPTTTILPNTLDGLVELLSTSATAYGTRGPTLLARLEEIQSINARKRGGRARREAIASTLDEIDAWVRDGALALPIATRAQDVLRALAA